jgi:hypothetical protein
MTPPLYNLNPNPSLKPPRRTSRLRRILHHLNARRVVAVPAHEQNRHFQDEVLGRDRGDGCGVDVADRGFVPVRWAGEAVGAESRDAGSARRGDFPGRQGWEGGGWGEEVRFCGADRADGCAPEFGVRGED